MQIEQVVEEKVHLENGELWLNVRVGLDGVFLVKLLDWQKFFLNAHFYWKWHSLADTLLVNFVEQCLQFFIALLLCFAGLD